MLTLNHGTRLVGIQSYHADDVMLAGDESDPVYLEALDTCESFYDRNRWGGRHLLTAVKFNHIVMAASRLT